MWETLTFHLYGGLIRENRHLFFIYTFFFVIYNPIFVKLIYHFIFLFSITTKNIRPNENVQQKNQNRYKNEDYSSD